MKEKQVGRKRRNAKITTDKKKKNKSRKGKKAAHKNKQQRKNKNKRRGRAKLEQKIGKGRREKSQKGNRQSTAKVNLTCLKDAVTFTKFLKDNVVNFLRRNTRLTAQNSLTNKKAAKKG